MKNVQSKSLLDNENYEYFDLAVPLKILLNGKYKQFLYGELGKLYPCFSESSCYDSRLYLGIHGFRASVIVLEKFLLSEFFQESKSNKVWVPEVKRNCFKRRNSLRTEIITGVSVVLLIFLFLIGIIGKSSGKKSAPVMEIEVAQSSRAFTPVGMNLSELLKIIEKSDGQISRLNWKVDGYKEIINISASNVFPEDFNKSGVKVVTTAFQYKEGIPYCDLRIEDTVSLKERQKETIESDDFRKDIRTKISKLSGDVLWENLLPYSFCFTSTRSDLSDLLVEINRIINEKSQNYISSIQIADSKENLKIEIQTTRLNAENSVLNIIKNYVHLFKENMQKDVSMSEYSGTRQDREGDSLLEQLPSLNWDKMTKIGEIIHENGNTILFYKNQEGRIYTKEKGAAE